MTVVSQHFVEGGVVAATYSQNPYKSSRFAIFSLKPATVDGKRLLKTDV